MHDDHVPGLLTGKRAAPKAVPKAPPLCSSASGMASASADCDSEKPQPGLPLADFAITASADTANSPRPLGDPYAPRPYGSSIHGFYGADASHEGISSDGASANATIGSDAGANDIHCYDFDPSIVMIKTFPLRSEPHEEQ